ncbi:MAG: hypothetical protein DRH24_06290 [Deltaproteobacteria bacterium]|nr:MAG: hypothetical protein DRH24_06290 [Deltaproteobacteria bacterium]
MIDWKATKIEGGKIMLAMIFVSRNGFFQKDMNFGNIINEIVHFASHFSCKIARFKFQSPLAVLHNHLNLLLLKPIF